MSDLVPRAIGVGQLLEDDQLDLRLELLAGRAGLRRGIDHTRIQKSGLALTGHFHGIVPTRVQILGETELSFLSRLAPADQHTALGGFFGLSLSCVMLTGTPRLSAEARAALVHHADATGTPLLESRARSSVTITALHGRLDVLLAPRERRHGVLIDSYGVGLLIVGRSGIGKSETALDLILRGHRLVADDAVECHALPPGIVMGQAAAPLRYLLEVRGLGILNVRDLFGITASRHDKRIDVVAHLDDSPDAMETDRLGFDTRSVDILGVSIPEIRVPVQPGRNIASILEVAARNHLLRASGTHTAREFIRDLEAARLGRPTEIGPLESSPIESSPVESSPVESSPVESGP